VESLPSETAGDVTMGADVSSEYGRTMASLALLGLALAGCSADPEQSATAPATTAPPTTTPPTTAPAPGSTSAPAATTSSAGAGPGRYTVRQTRPAGADGGASATLVLAKESKAEARAAIADYFRGTPPKGYLSVEALGRTGGTEWICMGERVTSEDDKQYAIFEGTQAISEFPDEWTECRD
jgi:hypothetical protein